MRTIGIIINEERIAENLKQSELATMVGVTQDSISLWEKDKRLPATQHIIDLCKIFNISADYLLGLVEEQAKK